MFKSHQRNHLSQKRNTFEIGRLQRVPRNQRYHQVEHMIERLLRARGHEMQDQFYHPSASVREKNSLGRMSVSVKTVLDAAREHEEETCKGYNHGQRNDSFYRNNSILTVPTRTIRRNNACNNVGILIWWNALLPSEPVLGFHKSSLEFHMTKSLTCKQRLRWRSEHQPSWRPKRAQHVQQHLQQNRRSQL